MSNNKLCNKYQISKTSGRPCDPEAEYFVLRLDTDPIALIAFVTYAAGVGFADKEYGRQLMDHAEKVAENLELTNHPDRLWTHEKEMPKEDVLAQIKEMRREWEERVD